MGCDGGTIPKRDELVRTKKKAEQKDKVSELNFLWRHCSIAQTPLREPIVACGLGKLYNKDSVILSLLERSKMPTVSKHIKSLKDVKELNLTSNPAFEASIKKGDCYDDHLSAPYICPLVGIEMNGKFKFCFNWGCGCVMSERAFKELKSNVCQKCQKPIDDNDLVVLNASDEDLDVNQIRMETRQAELKAARKNKKSNSVEIKEEPGTSSISLPVASGSTRGTVLEEPNAVKKNGVKKTDPEKCGFKRPATNLGMQTSDFKKTKGDYSVASDPSATSVFKSLFTSSSAAKSQEKAHWITYNPFYN